VVTMAGEPADYRFADDAPVIAVSAHEAAEPGANDWFDLGVTVSVAGEDVPFQTLFTALASDEDHLILDSGTWFRLDREEFATLRRLIVEARSLQDRPGQTLRITPYQAGLWEELVELGVVASQSERWERTVTGLLSPEEMPTPDLPAGLTATLRPYQVDGYRWLTQIWDLGLGGILADDMGLGKTLQMLALAQRAMEAGELTEPVLIVAPTSVLGTWASEAARFTPDLPVVVLAETMRRRGGELRDAIAGAALVVTSYAIFRIDEEHFQGQRWRALVLDEAQFVKNHQAKTYQCARRLEAPVKFAITGTPLENSLMDLWALLSIVAPGVFPSPQRFGEIYRRPIEAGGAPEVLASLRRRIRPLMLRRTKELVASELPPKQEQVVQIALAPGHRRTYDRHLQRERQRVLGLIEDDFNANRIAILKSLTTLRLMALHPTLADPAYSATVASAKVEALIEQLREVASEGHRALVFSQFTRFLAMIRERLDAEGITYSYLDGRTRDRTARIEGFRSGTDPVFLISLKAGGFGLT
ncbi:MAG TPA: DEAD/DEAH box helicase, partial [Candidatus Lustribacter sp.]|nr:DEAD/DEAH box helicase [Candidatus Lustribacter sp.]